MSEILERGDILFFYRPRVGVSEVRDLDDVQRFFIILAPEGSSRRRRLIVGRKRLPDPGAHEREWAFVADVVDDPGALREELTPTGRPVGEGRYAVVDHGGHTHLAYRLELPQEPGEAQRMFAVLPEGSYVIAVRNPDAPAPEGAGLGETQRADFPRELRERFDGRRFIPVNPPTFLDHEGAELVLIGAAERASEELGIDFDTEAEPLERADIFEKLMLRPGEVPTDPLERGALR
ncbi:MAG TPA: hypothetical protein VJT75_00435 [Thermoleophilaceae bacterium]|nr:hypothetical protein [Thermoleophilaceae bacterium]